MDRIELKIQVFVDSPLGLEVTKIYSDLEDFCDKEAKDLKAKENHPFDFNGLLPPIQPMPMSGCLSIGCVPCPSRLRKSGWCMEKLMLGGRLRWRWGLLEMPCKEEREGKVEYNAHY